MMSRTQYILASLGSSLCAVLYLASGEYKTAFWCCIATGWTLIAWAEAEL